MSAPRENRMSLTFISADASWTLACRYCKDEHPFDAEWFFEDRDEAIEATDSHLRWHKARSAATA